MTHTSPQNNSWGHFWGFPGKLLLVQGIFNELFPPFFPCKVIYSSLLNCKDIAAPCSRVPFTDNDHSTIKKHIGSSPVVQWLRLHLAMQGVQVRSLVRDQNIKQKQCSDRFYKDFIKNGPC